MNRIKIGPVGAIPPGASKGVSILGRRYAVFNIDGRLYGLDGSCKHMKASLVSARCEGTVVVCPMHGWKYDVTDGRCLTEAWARLDTYPVEVDEGEVFIIFDKDVQP